MPSSRRRSTRQSKGYGGRTNTLSEQTQVGVGVYSCNHPWIVRSATGRPLRSSDFSENTLPHQRLYRCEAASQRKVFSHDRKGDESGACNVCDALRYAMKFIDQGACSTFAHEDRNHAFGRSPAGCEFGQAASQICPGRRFTSDSGYCRRAEEEGRTPPADMWRWCSRHCRTEGRPLEVCLLWGGPQQR